MTNAATVLLLEDEALIALDIQEALEQVGFAVTTVATCQDAFAQLSAAKPDVVIVDIMLRDGPSNKVVAQLIDDNIPFIVHSGDQPSVYKGTPYEKGVWVNKPAGVNELEDAARALVLGQ